MTVKPTYEELEKRVQELEKIESELEYSKEMLQVYEKASLGYQSLDENGHYITVNQNWLDTLGYAKEEVIGKSFADFIHPDWRHHFKENFSRFKSIGEILGAEFEMVKKNGDLILVSLTGKISRDKKGDFHQTHCIFHDIADRKRVEEELQENEERYRILFEHTGEALFVAQEGRIVFQNPRSTKLSGYSAEEFQSKPFFDFIHEDDREMVTDHHIRRLKGEKLPERYNFRIIHKDGSILWTELNAVLFQWNGRPAVLCFMTDITERRHVEHELKRNEKLYRTLFSNAQTPIFMVDEKNRSYINANQAALDFMECTKEQLVGRSVYESSPPENIEKTKKEHADFSEIKSLETSYLVNGKIKILLLEVTPLELDGNTILIGIGQDITERKQAEQLLTESETRYKALHNASFGGITIHDQGIILECNKGLVEMTGYKYSELIGMDGLLLIAERSRGVVMNNIRSGYEKPYEALGLRKNGEEYPIRLEARNIPYKGKQVRTVEFRDITEQKKAENVLSESKELLARSQELVHIGSWKLDLIENSLTWSDETYRIFGYEPKAFTPTYEAFLGAVHPDDREMVNKAYSDSIREGRDEYEIQHRIIRSNSGEIRTLHERCIHEKDETGNILRSLGMAQDITERKMAEKQKEIIAHKYATVLATTTDAVIASDLDGRITVFNPGAERLFGCLADEALGSPIMRFCPEDRLEEQSEMMHRIRDAGAISGYESVRLTADGRRIPVEITLGLNMDDQGRPLGINAILRNITERKRAEQLLAESEAKFRSIYNHTAVGLAQVSLDLHIMSANKAYHDMLGYKENDLIGRHLKEITHLDVMDENFQKQTKLASGEIDHYHMEKKFIHKNGQTVHAILDANLIRDALGNPTYFLGSVVDFTKRKQAEAERKKLQAQLTQAQKMESIGSLAGGIAHDFNNLLFPIIGLSEMMLDDFPSDTPEYHNLHEIFKAGKRGRELVQQILSFSRQSEHQPIPVHIQRILKEVLKLCRATIPADIPIIPDIQIDCGPVMADPTQIHQIAMNLITNAYHAVESTSGTITVQLKETDFTQDDNPAFQLVSDIYAVLSVNDTGTGIDPAVINKIFDPYFTTKEKGRGTGLGLATVYGIIKAYGGDIKVQSELGKGSSFHVYLPLLEKTQESEPEKEMTPLPTGTGHILLLDDEMPIVQLEKQMLERLGYQTSVFTSSREALDAFRSEPARFDLVITDMNMPNMNGMQLATELIAIRPDIPIILCTGFSERIDNKKAESKGIRGLLLKPVGMKDFAQKVREVLDTIKK